MSRGHASRRAPRAGRPRRDRAPRKGSREHDVDHRGLELRASASRCPARNSAQKRARASGRPPPSSRSVFTAMRPRRFHNDVQRCRSASRRRFCILVHRHEAAGPPSGVVAGGTRREDHLLLRMVADKPPGLTPDALVEWMRVADLRRDGPATVGADGPQRRVPLGAACAAFYLA